MLLYILSDNARLALNVGLLRLNLYFSNIYFPSIRQKSCLKNYHLSNRTCYEISKSPWKSFMRIGNNSIYRSDKRVSSIQKIGLIRLPAITRRCYGCTGYRHYLYILLKSGIGSVSTIIQPIRANNTNSIRGLIYIIYYSLTVLCCNNIVTLYIFSL